MKVADVMVRGVISLAPGDSMRKAASLMLRFGVSGFPVLDHGKLVGIITQGDFLRRIEIGTEQSANDRQLPAADAGMLAEEYVHAHGRKIGEVMTRDVVTIDENAPLEDAARLMQRHQIKRIPVVRTDAVVGLICRHELLHAFIVSSPHEATAPADDRAIGNALKAALSKEPWVPQGTVSARVMRGVVHLEGVIRDERQRLGLRVMAENITGVRSVRDDHLKLDPVAR